MTIPFSYRLAAKNELDEAAEWYEGKQIGLARLFEEAVRAAIVRIQQNPSTHAIVFRDIRQVLVATFTYSVLYR